MNMDEVTIADQVQYRVDSERTTYHRVVLKGPNGALMYYEYKKPDHSTQRHKPLRTQILEELEYLVDDFGWDVDGKTLDEFLAEQGPRDFVIWVDHYQSITALMANLRRIGIL